MKWTMVCVIFCLLIMNSPANGDIYTWTDANGVKHFSNQPPPTRKNVRQQNEIKHSKTQYQQWNEQRKKNQSSALETNSRTQKIPANVRSRAGKTAKAPGKVVMYSTPTCGYCKRASSFFARHDIAFTEHDITTDKQAFERFKQLNGRGVPLILVGDQKIAGFNKPLLKSLFGIQ